MVEMIDVLDENGLRTGRTLTRDEVHCMGQWHRIAVVVVTDAQNRILLQQRSEDKMKDPGKWDITAAGHVDAGEDAKTTAVRELAEETGMTVKMKDLRRIMEYRGIVEYEWKGRR